MNDSHYTESKEEWRKRIWGRADRQRIKEEHADDIKDMKRDDPASLKESMKPNLKEDEG